MTIEKQSNQLKHLMLQQEITQTELAARIGQSRINFNKVVNNTRTLTIPVAKKCAKIFKKQWFEMFEPIDMDLNVHGKVKFLYDESKCTWKTNIELNDPVMDNLKQIRLWNYLAEAKDLICIEDEVRNMVWLMNKNNKNTDFTYPGIYYSKNINGIIRFIQVASNMDVYELNAYYGKKKVPAIKEKFEYVIPVARIDNSFNYLKDGIVIGSIRGNQPPENGFEIAPDL